MQTVTLEEAQAHLPELVARIQNGEEIVLTEKERPVAKIVALSPENEASAPPTRKAGSLRGMIVEREDCWEPETEMWKEYMP